MFIEVEGEKFINLGLISRVELRHTNRTALLYNAGVMEMESALAYQYFTNPGNREFLMVPSPKVE